MALVAIYHAKSIDAFFYREDGNIFNKTRALQDFTLGNYDRVADRQTEETPVELLLNRCYRETQNIEAPWNNHKPCRSTSVGDIIAIFPDGQDMELYIVASVGFDKLK